MNPNQLPAPAAEKLRNLAMAANDANALASSTLQAIDMAEQRLGDAQNLADSASDDIRRDKAREHVAALQKQIEHLKEVFARRQAEHAQILQVYNQCDLWVGRLEPSTRLEMVESAKFADWQDGETLSQAVERIRAQISETEAKLHQARHAPLPRQELRELAAEHVLTRAKKGRPRLSWREREGLVIDWAHPQSWGTGLDEMLNLACWLDTKAMAEKLFAEIDAQLKIGKDALPAQEREQTISRLTAQLDTLQREEESLVEQAGVPRRMGASPAAILGLRIASRRQEVAA